jgi:RNA polymerase sigma-70 factor (ECF subfamily)
LGRTTHVDIRPYCCVETPSKYVNKKNNGRYVTIAAVIRYIDRSSKQTGRKRDLMNDVKYIEFITKLRDTIYRLARSIIGDDAEAEDVMQDICERVWRARDKVLSYSNPQAYVCRMTRNLAIDHQRAKRHKELFAKDIESQTAMSDGNKDANISDMAVLTLKLIQQLPEPQRTIIHLRDIEGYEMADIAEIVERDESTVRVALSRARKSIRLKLIEIMNYGVK